jgi:hypothetical protein
MSCEYGGTNWNYANTAKGLLKLTEASRVKEGSLAFRFQKEDCSSDTFISDS